MKFRGSFHNTTTFRCHQVATLTVQGVSGQMAGRGHSTLPTISNCVISFISPLPAFGYLSHIDYLNTLALPGDEWHYLYLHYIFDVRSKTRVYKRSIKVEIARGWSVVAVLDS